MFTACRRLLPESRPAKIWTRKLLDRERTLYHYVTLATFHSIERKKTMRNLPWPVRLLFIYTFICILCIFILIAVYVYLHVCGNRWAMTAIWAMTRASWAGSRRVSLCWPEDQTSNVTSTPEMAFSSVSSVICRRGCAPRRSDRTPTVLYVYFLHGHYTRWHIKLGI